MLQVFDDENSRDVFTSLPNFQMYDDHEIIVSCLRAPAACALVCEAQTCRNDAILDHRTTGMNTQRTLISLAVRSGMITLVNTHLIASDWLLSFRLHTTLIVQGLETQCRTLCPPLQILVLRTIFRLRTLSHTLLSAHLLPRLQRCSSIASRADRAPSILQLLVGIVFILRAGH